MVFWKSRGTYWGKNCLKKLSFYIFLYLDRKIFRLLGKNISSVLSKRHSTCPGERVEDSFGKKRDRFSIVYRRNILDFSPKTFRRVAKIEFYMSKWTLWGNWFGKTFYNFYSFQTVRKNHSHFPQKFPASLSKLPSTSPGDCFQVLFWEIHMLFIAFAPSAKKQIHIWGKAFGMIVETVGVLRNILLRNIFLGKLKLFFFDFHTLREIFPDFRQKDSSKVVRAAL